jgi:hypothetical protein
MFGIKPASIFPKGRASGINLKGHLMGLSAILIVTALSLTMLVAVTDLPID